MVRHFTPIIIFRRHLYYILFTSISISGYGQHFLCLFTINGTSSFTQIHLRIFQSLFQVVQRIKSVVKDTMNSVT